MERKALLLPQTQSINGGLQSDMQGYSAEGLWGRDNIEQMCFHRQMLPNVRFRIAPSH